MTTMAVKNYSAAEKRVNEEIVNALKIALAGRPAETDLVIDYPPTSNLGDYTVACFSLAQKLKQPRCQIAAALSQKIKPEGLIKEVKAAGPYLNFFVDRGQFSALVLKEVAKQKQNYGSGKKKIKKTVMVEYFSPNTNKPLTIGHLRNICLGYSLARLLKFLGYKVMETTLYNDRGIAIAKAIVGYLKWGQGQNPKIAKMKPDHFVGSFYVRFCQAAKTDPALEKEAKRVLLAWEQGDKTVKATWQKLTAWVLAGFDQTLAKLGVTEFDEKYYESEYYQHGKEVVEQGLKKGVFIKDQAGVVVAPLAKYGLADKIVLRPDNTSLYITQDLHLAYLKDRHQLDESIYVVGDEQDLYLKQLFKILELMGFKNADKYYHLSYGMIRLPSGRIKSREGLLPGTGADELISQLENLAAAEIKSRFPELDKTEISRRAEGIALAALKFYILAVGPKNTMVFDPHKSLVFNGRTGPYLQYVHARICSIFKKAKTKPSGRVEISVLSHDLEFNLVKLLARFPSVILAAAANHDPSQVANYLYELAQSFSLLYEQLPVLKAEAKLKKARLFLIDNVRIVLAQGLSLLGIVAPEKM